MDTRSDSLGTTNNNGSNHSHPHSFDPFHPHERHSEEVGNLHREIDTVRMNLGAELAELRQRRTVAEQQIAALMEKAMVVYTVVLALRSIIALFGKKDNKSKDVAFLRSVAVQLGTYAASRALLHYRNRRNQVDRSMPKHKLLTDSSRALKDWKEPNL